MRNDHTQGGDMSWKDKTCEKCVYRVLEWCRRFPFGVRKSEPYEIEDIKPIKYSDACAEYKEEI